MNLKFRLKAALKSFINPVPTPNLLIQQASPEPLVPKLVIREPSPEPTVVIDRQLLAGKNVLITGAGQNIGRNIALEMAKQGANIFFTDLIEENCTNLEKELKIYPIIGRGFCSDISKIESIDVLSDIFAKENIKIDILVNNVGISPKAETATSFDLKEVYKLFDTNLFGPMYLTKSIAKGMIDRNIYGSIIFITSIHQWTIRRFWSYSSSKAALGMIIKELAVDLAPYQIRVNGIAPGWIWEDLQGKPSYNLHTPLFNSSINPRYIGRGAVYLASDYFSRFTTGTVIKIDAGLSLYNNSLAENSIH